MKIFGEYLKERENIRLRNKPNYESCLHSRVIGQAWNTGDQPPLYVECEITGSECLGDCSSHRRSVMDLV